MEKELGSKTITLTLKEVVGILIFIISFVSAISIGLGTYYGMQEKLNNLINDSKLIQNDIKTLNIDQAGIRKDIENIKINIKEIKDKMP